LKEKIENREELKDPLISIVIATYNCSHFLKYAIKSVILSDYNNWEIIVVGDCCTDDTEDCVNSFGDDRISFINLEENSGQQAKPNNVGLSKARGTYIAFLNQDDMYFPYHLSECVKYIEEMGVEIICAPGIRIFPTDASGLSNDQYDVELIGVPPNGTYTPHIFYVASSLFFSKSLIDKVGPWVTEKKSYVTPSQEWIFRAWKKGAIFHFLNKVGVLILFSSSRENSYQNKESFEHTYFFQKINKDSEFMTTLLERAAIKLSTDKIRIEFYRPFRSFLRICAYPIYRLLESFSIHPSTLHMIMRWGGKGKYIDHLKKRAGVR